LLFKGINSLLLSADQRLAQIAESLEQFRVPLAGLPSGFLLHGVASELAHRLHLLRRHLEALERLQCSPFQAEIAERRLWIGGRASRDENQCQGQTAGASKHDCGLLYACRGDQRAFFVADLEIGLRALVVFVLGFLFAVIFFLWWCFFL